MFSERQFLIYMPLSRPELAQFAHDPGGTIRTLDAKNANSADLNESGENKSCKSIETLT